MNKLKRKILLALSLIILVQTTNSSAGDLSGLLKQYTQEEYDFANQARMNANKAFKNWSGIASDKDSEAYKNRLNQLGIPTEEDNLFIFASWSMPQKLIKAYVKKGAFSGATVVFRGIPKDAKNVNDYIKRYIQPLSDPNGQHANILVDPLLFDYYDVSVVPTLVYSTLPARNKTCEEGGVKTAIVNETAYDFKTCGKADENLYIKSSGGTTIKWLLEQAVDNGFVNAGKRLDASIKFSTGESSFSKELESSLKHFGNVSKDEKGDRIFNPYSTEKFEPLFKRVQQ